MYTFDELPKTNSMNLIVELWKDAVYRSEPLKKPMSMFCTVHEEFP